ncbi:hypothetical protein NKG05_20215 [Oerskovia sp. M15]
MTYRVLDGGPEAPVALGWVTEEKSDLVEEFIGIVRGRTANSSRASPPHPAHARGEQEGGRAFVVGQQGDQERQDGQRCAQRCQAGRAAARRRASRSPSGSGSPSR